MTVVEATTNNINVNLSVCEEAQGSFNNSQYEISYKNTDYTDCFNISNTSNTIPIHVGSRVPYTIEGLQEGTTYSITVSLLREDGAIDTTTVLRATAEAGSYLPAQIIICVMS